MDAHIFIQRFQVLLSDSNLRCCITWMHCLHLIDVFQITICCCLRVLFDVASTDRTSSTSVSNLLSLFCIKGHGHIQWCHGNCRGICYVRLQKTPYFIMTTRKYALVWFKKRNDVKKWLWGMLIWQTSYKLKTFKNTFSGSSTKTATRRMSVSSTEQWFIATPSSPLWPLLKPWRVSRSTTATLQEW